MVDDETCNLFNKILTELSVKQIEELKEMLRGYLEG